jgi:hypothetical protein
LKNLSENYPKFWHVPIKRFASSFLGRNIQIISALSCKKLLACSERHFINVLCAPTFLGTALQPSHYIDYAILAADLQICTLICKISIKRRSLDYYFIGMTSDKTFTHSLFKHYLQTGFLEDINLKVGYSTEGLRKYNYN